jgi:UDP-N-acetylmuramate--alanine ligase
MSTQADFQATHIEFSGLQSRFTVYHMGQRLGKILVNLPGIHNVSNSLASVAVGMEVGISFQTIKEALETHEGVQRRMEIKGQKKGITVVDDYGHHPTEIKMTLQAAKESWPNHRLVVAFQPHRYSRTKGLFDEFTRSFYQSDVLVVLPIYPAGEQPLPGIDSHNLLDSIVAHGHRKAIFYENFDSASTYLAANLKNGDIFLTLGAGDIYQLGEIILKKIDLL